MRLENRVAIAIGARQSIGEGAPQWPLFRRG